MRRPKSFLSDPKKPKWSGGGGRIGRVKDVSRSKPHTPPVEDLRKLKEKRRRGAPVQKRGFGFEPPKKGPRPWKGRSTKEKLTVAGARALRERFQREQKTAEKALPPAKVQASESGGDVAAFLAKSAPAQPVAADQAHT